MATKAQLKGLEAARAARAAGRGTGGGKTSVFKQRMSVLIVALVAVGGALIAALSPSVAAPDDDEDDELPEPEPETDEPEPEPEPDEPEPEPEPEPDEPDDDDDAPPNVDDCDVDYETARVMLNDAALADDARAASGSKQATANLLVINSLLARFPLSQDPATDFPLGTNGAAEACALQNKVADNFASWTDTDVWPGADVIEEGGDGGDDEEGGGGQGNGDDEPEEPADEEGTHAPCSEADVSGVAQVTMQQLAPYIINAANPPQMQEEGFLFPAGSWTELRNYYADAAIAVALTMLGEDIEFMHNYDAGSPCYYKEPSQLALRNAARQLWDTYHPGGKI